MSFLRTAFWVSLVIFLIPAGQHDQTDLIGTTKTSLKNMNQFCARNVDICEIGNEAWTSFKNKASYGAKSIYAYMKEKTLHHVEVANHNTPKRHSIGVENSNRSEFQRTDQQQYTPQNSNSMVKKTVTNHSQNTLTNEDLEPGWQVPSSEFDG